jgi:hypothetical protein
MNMARGRQSLERCEEIVRKMRRNERWLWKKIDETFQVGQLLMIQKKSKENILNKLFDLCEKLCDFLKSGSARKNGGKQIA